MTTNASSRFGFDEIRIWAVQAATRTFALAGALWVLAPTTLLAAAPPSVPGGPDGSYVFYFDGSSKSPGDYNYSGATTNYRATPRVPDPLFPSQKRVTETEFPAGQNAGYQPRMPGDNLDVSGYKYLWLRILPDADTNHFFSGAALPGDVFIHDGEVTAFAIDPIKAGVWNWLKIPLSFYQMGAAKGLYKYSIVLPGPNHIQIGYQGFSIN